MSEIDIKSLRHWMRMNQTEFAAHFGVVTATIARWETRGLPRNGMAEKTILAAALEAKKAGWGGRIDISTVPREPSERNEATKQKAIEMAQQFRAGSTLQQVGDRYGVSREYVRQLLERYVGIKGESGGQAVRAAAKRKASLERADAKSMLLHGMTRAEYKGAHAHAKKIGGSSPSYAYRHQRRSAKFRGIGWEMTFAQWWAIWLASGKFADRGKYDGQFVMARHGDVGPYAPDNVSIITAVANIQQYMDSTYGADRVKRIRPSRRKRNSTTHNAEHEDQNR